MKSADGRFNFLDDDVDPLPAGSPIEQAVYVDIPCPIRGGRCGAVMIRGRGTMPEVRPSWILTGTVDAPTLEPSVNCLSGVNESGVERAGCGWHGYFIDGAVCDTNRKPMADASKRGEVTVRLIDLDPQWLVKDDRRVGFVFRCPHCRGCYLSCFFEAMPVKAQFALIANVLPAGEVNETVPCKSIAWWAKPKPRRATFETLSVTPSIDASPAGHWHGHVTKGLIVGGLEEHRQ